MSKNIVAESDIVFQEKPTHRLFKDLTGQAFGRLTVLGYAGETASHHKRWYCQCTCGNIKIISAADFTSGKTISCGCARDAAASKAHTTHGFTRGGHIPDEYKIWHGILKRCYNNAAHAYERYGGRGIKVSPRYLGPDGFVNFLADMGPRPSKRHSIDRIDVNGDYEPGNMRWATPTEQSNNTRRNVRLTIDGEEKTAAEWANVARVNHAAVLKRLKRGWSPKEAVFGRNT